MEEEEAAVVVVAVVVVAVSDAGHTTRERLPLPSFPSATQSTVRALASFDKKKKRRVRSARVPVPTGESRQ